MTDRCDDILDLGSWCILRCRSAQTIQLMRSLNEAGLDAWTPIEKRVHRLRQDRSRLTKEQALMPSYAFGRVEHVNELLRVSRLPNHEHPEFSVYHFRGAIPLIADRELDALRQEEDRTRRVFDRLRRRGTKGPQLAKGTVVRMSEGPFAGLSGIVEDQRGQYTLVSFDGFHDPLKVASLLLLEEESGEVARAA